MRYIIIILMVILPTFLFSQTVGKIRVCDDPKLEKYFNECKKGSNDLESEREREFYIESCKKNALSNFCEYKKVLIIKNDTLYCDQTKKKKYLKLCE